MKRIIIMAILIASAFAWSRQAKPLPMGQITTSSKASVPNIEISGTHVQNVAANRFTARLELDVTHKNRDSMFIKMNHARDMLYKKALAAGIPKENLEHQSISTDEKWDSRYDKEKDKYNRYFIGYHIHQNFNLSADTKKEILIFLNSSIDIPHLSIEWVSPGLKDKSTIRTEMMKLATQKALDDAAIYAEAAKSKVGRVLYIADGEYFDIRPHYVHFYGSNHLHGLLGGGGGGIGSVNNIITKKVYDENSIADSLEVGASVLMIVELK